MEGVLQTGADSFSLEKLTRLGGEKLVRRERVSTREEENTSELQKLSKRATIWGRAGTLRRGKAHSLDHPEGTDWREKERHNGGRSSGQSGRRKPRALAISVRRHEQKNNGKKGGG